MEWYLPFTLLSSAGLLVLSTSNFINGLNDEIYQLEQMEKEEKVEVISLKLEQLKLISIAIVLQYIALFLFASCSIIIAFFEQLEFISKGMIIIGVLLISASLLMLIVFSYRAIGIRQKHLKI